VSFPRVDLASHERGYPPYGRSLTGLGGVVLTPAPWPDTAGCPTDDVGTPKFNLASRNARRARTDITLTSIARRVEHPDAKAALVGCDWSFLAADGHAAALGRPDGPSAPDPGTHGFQKGLHVRRVVLGLGRRIVAVTSIMVEPPEGVEPSTYALRVNNCACFAVIRHVIYCSLRTHSPRSDCL
jgi:hypothetical protein